MSFKVTRKAIMQEYSLVIEIPYCKFQNALSVLYPIAHTEGIYGWNADIYDMEDVGYYGIAICTGYRPFGFRSSSENEDEAVERMERITKDYRSGACNWEFWKSSMLKILTIFLNNAMAEANSKKS